MSDSVPAPWAIRICGAVVDVSDGPYGEPIPWQLCDLLEGHTGDCDTLPGPVAGYHLAYAHYKANARADLYQEKAARQYAKDHALAFEPLND